MTQEFTKYPHTADGHQYALDAERGAVDVCRWVKLQAKKHLEDLDRQSDPAFPFYFDPKKANEIGHFASLMMHVKGKWAQTPTPVLFEPWQEFAFGIPLGWMKKDGGKRRYRNMFDLIPRKNGKSVSAAILGNYMLTADGEPGAEVYCGASKEKQAWEVFGPARLMALNNPFYREYYGLHVGAKNIAVLNTASKFEPVIGNPGDGSSPHCGIADEEHEHLDSRLVDTFQTGMGAREQPLLLEISTAGTNLAGPCYAKQQLVQKVLEGTLENDELWGLIYTIDPEDDWTDFEVWRKANPNFGVSVFEDFLLARYREAMQSPDKQNINLCKHLNVWSNAAVGWINMVKWEECADKNLLMDRFKGCQCWVGVDLASKVDLTAMMFLFRREGEYYLFGKYYLPEDTVRLPENSHYQRWAAEGYLTVTPGARTDYRYLEEDLAEIAKAFSVRELAYDQREAEYLMQNIREWASFPCVEVPQSPTFISEPMKEFEALYLSGKLHHDGNPMLRWQASNVIRKSSKAKSYYPAKEREANKIDGIVAAIMALSRAMTFEDPASVYESRGLIVL
ncbi:terminase large subunit [Desulfovibrio sp. OttesenSCG-928-A18]|nr:terminase large subunit [Desulfovibrio sp. OttesenSCG-928-A18]